VQPAPSASKISIDMIRIIIQFVQTFEWMNHAGTLGLTIPLVLVIMLRDRRKPHHPCEIKLSTKTQRSKPQPLKLQSVPSSNSIPNIIYSGTRYSFGPRMRVNEEPRHKTTNDAAADDDDDKKLFAMPPPPEECPLCCHQMPVSAWETDPGVSNRISKFRPCCGKNICCGCVFAVHHPEFKDPETFMRSINPVFLTPRNGGATAVRSSNKGKGKKKDKGNNKKKGRKGSKGAVKAQLPKDVAKYMSLPCKAEPPSGKTPPPSSNTPLSSEERGCTVQLHLDGTLKWESQNTCPFCRSPELKGADLLAALQKRIDDLNCDESHFEMGANYYEGANGLEKSLKKARECWEKSAELGNMWAHFSLAMYLVRSEKYWKGLGYEEDMSGSTNYKLARYHFTKAAIKGHPDARYNLAYYEVKDSNIHRAFAHYQIAAKQGSLDALKQCEEVYLQGAIISASDYESCVKAKESVWKEMYTKERLLAMRHRRLMKMGVMKSDPIGSFAAEMYGQVFKNHGIMFNGRQKFQFNQDTCKYEEVKDKEVCKMVGRLTTDGRPLQRKIGSTKM